MTQIPLPLHQTTLHPLPHVATLHPLLTHHRTICPTLTHPLTPYQCLITPAMTVLNPTGWSQWSSTGTNSLKRGNCVVGTVYAPCTLYVFTHSSGYDLLCNLTCTRGHSVHVYIYVSVQVDMSCCCCPIAVLLLPET